MRTFRNQQAPRPKKSSLIIGRRNVLDAIREGMQLERIYIQNTVYGELIEDIRQEAFQKQVPVNKVPVEKLNGFNIENHEGCVALVAKIQYQDLQMIIDWVVEKGEVPLFLILDSITDIRNIGGIARTAFCCGVHGIIIPDKGVGTLNEEAILTSAGALEKIPVCRVNSLMKTVDDLHLNGISVYASEKKAEKSIVDIDLTGPSAIIVGSEDKGIFPALSKICDEQVRIPMKGDFDSLNVSVATGMILYEVGRQRTER